MFQEGTSYTATRWGPEMPEDIVVLCVGRTEGPAAAWRVTRSGEKDKVRKEFK